MKADPCHARHRHDAAGHNPGTNPGSTNTMADTTPQPGPQITFATEAFDAGALDDGSLLALRSGTQRVLLAPQVGGSIAAFYDWHDGRATHWLRPATRAALDACDPLGMASFPLFPYCNRIRDARFEFNGRTVDLSQDGNPFPHALHGHAWRRPWRVGDYGPDYAVLHFLHEPGTAPAHHWPFRYEAEQRFELDAQGMRVTLSARNLSDKPMPLGMGHHPYYPRTPNTSIRTQVAAMWRGDADLLPEALVQHGAVRELASIAGMSPDAFDLDNNFIGWSRSATIAWPDQQRRLLLQADPAFAHLVIFAQADAPSMLCVEPVTNTTDWLNAPPADMLAPDPFGGHILAPGESLSASFRWLAQMTAEQA